MMMENDENIMSSENFVNSLSRITQFIDYNEKALDVIKAMRKEYVKHQDMLHQEKKKLGRDDVELIKHIKEEIKIFMRLEKSANLWIHWLDGDKEDLRFDAWPRDYYSELRFVIGKYELSC